MNASLIPGLQEARPHLIKRHIKNKAYSIANPKLPSMGPPSKNQKINLNGVPSTGQMNNYTKQRANFSSYGCGGKKASEGRINQQKRRDHVAKMQ